MEAPNCPVSCFVSVVQICVTKHYKNIVNRTAVIAALFDILDDKSDEVRHAVSDSVRKISRQSPEVVIHVAVYYWELHRKVG